MALTFGSLFSGIGGFERGLEACGMQCKWQVEIDDYATKVLSKHWPDVPKFRDVREFPPRPVSPWLSGEWAWQFRVDGICAGFPCQDISYAGTGAGLSGARSGLFFEVIRVVQELRPKFIILENVAALLTRGLDRVLGTLAEIGYNAEWHCIPAAAIGAPHIRDRIFIIAYAQCLGRHTWSGVSGDQKETRCGRRESQRGNQVLADSDNRLSIGSQQEICAGRNAVSVCGEIVADSDESRPQGVRAERQSEGWEDPDGYIRSRRLGLGRGSKFRAVEPRFCRISDGISKELDEGGLDVNGRWIQVSRSEITWNLLRALWNDGQLECTPQGREFGEQFAREYPNIVQQLSHETSLGERQDTVEEIRLCLCCLRQGVDSWHVRNASNTIEAAWQSSPQEAKDWFRLGTCGRTNWSAGEWPGVARIETRVANRVHRLKCLGNAIVPQAAEVAGQIVVDFFESIKTT